MELSFPFKKLLGQAGWSMLSQLCERFISPNGSQSSATFADPIPALIFRQVFAKRPSSPKLHPL